MLDSIMHYTAKHYCIIAWPGNKCICINIIIIVTWWKGNEDIQANTDNTLLQLPITHCCTIRDNECLLTLIPKRVVLSSIKAMANNIPTERTSGTSDWISFLEHDSTVVITAAIHFHYVCSQLVLGQTALMSLFLTWMWGTQYPSSVINPLNAYPVFVVETYVSIKACYQCILIHVHGKQNTSKIISQSDIFLHNIIRIIYIMPSAARGLKWDNKPMDWHQYSGVTTQEFTINHHLGGVGRKHGRSRKQNARLSTER